VPGARALLARDTDPAPLEVVRAVEYRFSATRAASWRAGRVLLAGDAAHTMPPFAGQGLGAGLRDAWALGALLPRARRPDDLDAYQRLREPHLRRVTALSLLLGAVLQARSPAAAVARDAALRRAFRAPVVGPWLGRGGPRPERSGVLDL
jgi:3-(3-hydroxy-phenyl)propionate hydroxylase